MNKVLVILSSVNGQKSITNQMAKVFVNKYQQLNPQDEVQYLDLNELEAAKQSLNKQNFVQFFGSESDELINQLKSVNKVVITAPMYNFNIPATLKNYLDRVLVANKTFSYKYSKKGDAVGLLDHLKVQILATQGAPLGWYEWGNHVKYLEGTFKFVYAELNESFLIDGTKVGELATKSAQEVVAMHQNEIEKLASQF
ncbi:FMN-dependent NADH-azoreductase [Mycoplasma sp. 128]